MNVPKRLIKKYPNRRLYDTECSCYITLADVKTLVLQHVPLRVIDTRTQEDVTNNTLLQIIMELEQQGAPLFTTTMLQRFIHVYGSGLQKELMDFLEKSIQSYHPQTIYEH
jgi:polyhydroxyalkanoate synthesis repressor PhaR